MELHCQLPISLFHMLIDTLSRTFLGGPHSSIHVVRVTSLICESLASLGHYTQGEGNALLSLHCYPGEWPLILHIPVQVLN